MATYLITGSSRGLGLALVKQLVALPHSQVRTVFATARSENSAALQELVHQHTNRVVLVKLDVSSQPSISTAMAKVKEHLRGQGLDVLINNAGIQTICPAGMHAVEDLNEIFNANVTSVHMVTRAFLPLLSKGGQKVNNMLVFPRNHKLHTFPNRVLDRQRQVRLPGRPATQPHLHRRMRSRKRR
jgi:NAD(P)-dependent dehydrogenase (short-subunit alcohol dehydrogenase family)